MRILWCPTISEDEVECTLVGSGVSGIWLTVIHVLTFKVFLEVSISRGQFLSDQNNKVGLI